jgi:hypothetical protein
LVIGWWAGSIPKKVFIWKEQQKQGAGEVRENEILVQQKKRKRKWLEKGVLIVWIFLIFLYCQSYFKIGKPILPPHLLLQIFIRSIIIVLAWYFVIGPLISYLLKEWLQRKQLKSKAEIQQVAGLLPDMQRLIKETWLKTKEKKGMKRIILFTKNVFVNILTNNAR